MPKHLYSVSAITAIIRDKLEHGIGEITVEGEVSNFSQPANSKHIYFTIKDTTSLLNVTFFSGAQARMGGALPQIKNGLKIQVTGFITLYPPQGRYQLNAHSVSLSGEGDLLVRFDQLKRKLYAEGVCDPSLKKTLPMLPVRVGIVTAQNGAALRDILQILKRRYPNLNVIIAPARVQGNGAAEEIAASINLLNRIHGPTSIKPVDAMIIGRGGGSLEDLWCFNEEIVARAIIASKIPVISAVGHEPDIAITDFVSDVRAPTPSAAAELICGCKEDFMNALQVVNHRLSKTMQQYYVQTKRNLSYLNHSALFRDPQHYLNIASQRTDTLATHLRQAFTLQLSQHQALLSTLTNRFDQYKATSLVTIHTHMTQQSTKLDHLFTASLTRYTQSLDTLANRINDLSPFVVLARGYSMTTLADGTFLKDAKQVQPSDTITTRLANGTIHAIVTSEKKTPPTYKRKPAQNKPSDNQLLLFNE